MSKIVYICHRNRNQAIFSKKDIELLSRRLSPDNIFHNPPLIIEEDGILVGIFKPVDSLPIKNQSVCLGSLINEKEDWWRPGAEAPDGVYALFRSNEAKVELVSDIVATRTIWYAHVEDFFIASTSQRAIVFFLKKFEPNREVYPWMLSSGTLGPSLSWDRRIQCLAGNARLTLDRASWKTELNHQQCSFNPLEISVKEHKRRLQEVIEDTFEHLALDSNNWLLPLSGGVDSRGILTNIKNRKGLKTITWGVGSALRDKASDAYVAKSLVKHYELEHEYLETDMSSQEPASQIIDRFILAGEGRVDKISGYTDGFGVWKQLYESHHQGIIRGDEAFGCRAVRSPWDVYRNMSLTRLDDYEGMESILHMLGNYEQVIPEYLQRHKDESIEVWRDRVNCEFEIPTVFAALNDLKLQYVEVINPFLSRRIVETVRQLPDNLRTGKRLFREIVSSKGPEIKFASRKATESSKNFLREPCIVNAISNQLKSSRDKGVIPESFIDAILFNMQVGKANNNNSIIAGLNKIGRKVIARMSLEKTRLVMDPNIIAFRAYIITRMVEILAEDAEVLRDRDSTEREALTIASVKREARNVVSK